MIETAQVPTLYLLASTGIIFGFLALVVVSLNYLGTRRNRRAIKTILQGIELLLAGQENEKDEKKELKAYLQKTLRELEHDHDKFKDGLEGYAQSLARIEMVVRQVKENQHSYLMKNNNASSANNKVKITTPPAPEKPEVYETQLVNALLRNLVDKMHNLGNQFPPNHNHQPPPNS